MLAGGTLLACGALAFGLWVRALPPLPKPDTLASSIEVVDRDGRLLRPYATEEGRWRLKAGLEDVDPRYLGMLIAYGDVVSGYVGMLV